MVTREEKNFYTLSLMGRHRISPRPTTLISLNFLFFTWKRNWEPNFDFTLAESAPCSRSSRKYSMTFSPWALETMLLCLDVLLISQLVKTFLSTLSWGFGWSSGPFWRLWLLQPLSLSVLIIFPRIWASWAAESFLVHLFKLELPFFCPFRCPFENKVFHLNLLRPVESLISNS